MQRRKAELITRLAAAAAPPGSQCSHSGGLYSTGSYAQTGDLFMEPMDADRASCMEMVDPALMTLKSGAQFQTSNLNFGASCTAARVKIPPLPATSHVINSLPEQALIPKQLAKQPTPDENPPSTKNGRVTKARGKGSKMRPSPTKNIQTNGTTVQFCAHYGDLTAAQRKCYDDEAVKLASPLLPINI
ncbi:hypothetical protein M405DRAFT_858025 [Rhizopogon salebrosus TDB-379]|nr:hypothetical protein M405DRAFT_858025 [Rhizopogon salebrosus TDB-379]